jgi:MarR family transcriptional regulator, transcriptional regulator for hemolysin
MSGIKDIWAYAHNIIRTSRQLINDELKPLGLSSAEGNILLHLLTLEQPPPQEHIVETLDISKPAVSRALESLESKGYIRRIQDKADKRAKRVYLTAKARQIGPQVEQIYSHVFSIGAQGISEGEIREFIGLFARVSASFTTAREKRRSAE